MAEDALTGPCSTGIPELNLVKFSLDYFPLLLRWHGAVMWNGLGCRGWLRGRIEDNLGCGGLSPRALFEI
jgi:hypothetical protein